MPILLREEFLTCRISPEEYDGRFGASPLERRIADCGAGGSGAFPRRCLGARDEVARGGELLHPREAVDRMDCVKQHEAEALANAGHRLPQIQGMSVMVLGGCDDGECDLATQRIVGGDEREINFDALVHRRIGKALGDPISVGFVGDLFADGREVIRAVGIVDLRQEVAAFSG